MYIYSKETGAPVFIIAPAIDGGFQWRMLWRYNETSQVFRTIDEASTDAQKRYEALREETATIHMGRRGECKEYHI